MSGLIHATAITIGEDAIILRGAPGSGKSRLALALINAATERCGIRLIGDDRIEARPVNGRLLVTGHPSIAGLIELRGAGIVTMPYVQHAVARMIVDCNRAPERLPHPDTLWDEISGIHLPRAFVDAGAGEAAQRVLLLHSLCGDPRQWSKLASGPSMSSTSDPIHQ